MEGRIRESGETFVSSHRPRQLALDDVRRSGLILTASRSERAAVARLDPSARSRTFTLREAAALAAGATYAAEDVGPFERFASTINARRGLVQPARRPRPRGLPWARPRPVDDPLDIVDGHNLSVRQHRSALDEVASAVDGILDELRASVS